MSDSSAQDNLPTDDTQCVIDAAQYVKRHEGYTEFPKPDTGGSLVVGHGTNFTFRGMSLDEARFFLIRDCRKARDELGRMTFWPKLNLARRSAVIDMVYCLGLSGFLQFHQLIAHLSCESWDAASTDILDSSFGRTSAHRAKENAYIIRTGVYPEE